MFLEEKDEKKLETRTIDCVFWRYKKIFFWSWNIWEHFKITNDMWYILTLFETIFLKLEMLIYINKQERKVVHSGAI